MTKIVEQYYPIAVSIVVGLFYWLFVPDFGTKTERLDIILNDMVNIGIIAMAFLSIVMFFICSLQKNRDIEALKKSGKYFLFTGYYVSAVQYCFVLTVLSMMGLGLELFCESCIFRSVWCGSLVASILSCYRIIGCFVSILRLHDAA